MEKQIKISKFFITAPVDENVGDFPQTWILESNFHFENEIDLDDFKENILQAFERAFDINVYIETAEEIALQEELHITITEQMLNEFDDDVVHHLRKMKDDE